MNHTTSHIKKHINMKTQTGGNGKRLIYETVGEK